MLADPDQLEASFWMKFFCSDLKISVKTRIGLEEPGGVFKTLRFFNRFPLSELIVQSGDSGKIYKGKPDL